MTTPTTTPTVSPRFPEKAPELFAYQASIIRAERNYDDKRWVAYDRRYRREALAQKDLNWSVTNTRLYNEAFTGRARAIPRCSYCLQEDHTAQYCPRNPNRPWFSWFPNPIAWESAMNPRQPPQRSPEICRRFNEGRCRQSGCRYTHTCLDCYGPHPRVTCPHKGNERHSSSLAKACYPTTGIHNQAFSPARAPWAHQVPNIELCYICLAYCVEALARPQCRVER